MFSTLVRMVWMLCRFSATILFRLSVI